MQVVATSPIETEMGAHLGTSQAWSALNPWLSNMMAHALSTKLFSSLLYYFLCVCVGGGGVETSHKVEEHSHISIQTEIITCTSQPSYIADLQKSYICTSMTSKCQYEHYITTVNKKPQNFCLIIWVIVSIWQSAVHWLTCIMVVNVFKLNKVVWKMK